MSDNMIITVKSTRLDGFGDMWVTHEGGDDEVKIARKRSHLQELFLPGRAVMLHYEKYKGWDYVVDAKLVEKELPKTPVPQKEQASNEKPSTPHAPQELGMWWKEVGEGLRTGLIDPTTPMGKALYDFYFAQMFSVLSITVEEEELVGLSKKASLNE